MHRWPELTAAAVGVVLATAALTAPAAADEPEAPPTTECVQVSTDPEVWMTSGIPLPCGPSLDLPYVAQTYPPIDPATGCSDAVASDGCPGDQAPPPAAAVVQDYCDDSTCTVPPSTTPETTPDTTTTTTSTSSTTTSSTTTSTTTTTTSTTIPLIPPQTGATTTTVEQSPPACTSGCGPVDTLPNTGSRAVIMATPLALLVLGTGVVMLAISRRRGAR